MILVSKDNKMVTVIQLRQTLKDMGLKTGGSKSELIKRIDDAKKDILSPYMSNWMRGHNIPPLNEDNIWKASSRGDIGGVKWFIYKFKMEAEGKWPGKIGEKSYYNIDQLSLFGRSALHHASLSGSSHIVRLLLSEGAIDYNGSVYSACVLPQDHNIMEEYGFTGGKFVELPHVKLLNAKRNLLLAKPPELNYDIIMEIEKIIKYIFTDKEIYRNTLMRAIRE